MAVRDETMQIAVRIAQMVRDTGTLSGEVVLQNGFRATWQAFTLTVDNKDGIHICAPIGELAALRTERWG